MLLLALMSLQSLPASAQSFFHRIDSTLAARYYRKTGFDTTYISRPMTKWTITARANVSGAKIESEGMDQGVHFKSEMEANQKATLFGFDIIYQDAKNFTGWYQHDGMERVELTDGKLSMKTLNLNAFYVFNSRRFSYPAAFSQTYIQRRSAGSFLLAFSGQGQLGKLKMEKNLDFKMMNIGLGAGYGYNFVPGKGWLLHISALPALIILSKTSMSFGEERVPMTYDFPEIIITGRGSVVRQWSNKFLGLSVVFTYTDIGKAENLTVNNNKWRIRTFFGWRL